VLQLSITNTTRLNESWLMMVVKSKGRPTDKATFKHQGALVAQTLHEARDLGVYASGDYAHAHYPITPDKALDKQVSNKA